MNIDPVSLIVALGSLVGVISSAVYYKAQARAAILQAKAAMRDADSRAEAAIRDSESKATKALLDVNGELRAEISRLGSDVRELRQEIVELRSILHRNGIDPKTGQVTTCAQQLGL